MTTARIASWPAITAPRAKRCSSMSRVAAPRRRRHERTHDAPGHRTPPHRRDDPALLVFAAVVVATASGAAVLAIAAGHHLGLPADLHRAECGVLRARRRYADRCRDPVGHPVSRSARLFDLVPRG